MKTNFCLHCRKQFTFPDCRNRIFCSVSCRRRGFIRHIKPIPPEGRFFDKVKKTDSCWLWQGSTCNGYGQVMTRVNKKSVKIFAHRLSYEIHNGKIPPHKCVCHSCDNRRCVNPSHLWLGTQMDNLRDCKAKGRNNIGERQGHAKLKANQINKIRELSETVSNRKIARHFNVSSGTISAILGGRTWKHIN